MATTRIKHVYGNVLRIAIPLTLRKVEVVDGETSVSDTDFIPSSNYPVTVTFSCKGMVKRFVAEMQGNVARIYDNGTLPVGDWSITIKCRDDEGRPYRFKRRSTVAVYECTIDADIKQPVDYDSKVWYLDAAIYLDSGGGITEETDPVFTASPAAGITQSNIANWNSKVNPSSLAPVATSGSYNDLTDKPTIPEDMDLSNYYDKDEVDGMLEDKADSADLSAVATTGSYNDLSNKPTIPSVQDVLEELPMFADVATTGDYSDLENTPNLATVATSGSYNDLTDKPTIPEGADLTGYATEQYVNTAIAGLVDSSPETLDTLNELAAALGDDPTFATTMTTALGNKVDKESGKSLMTDAERTKLAGIAAGAEVNVNADWNAASGDAQILNKPNLATVATSGSYNDLSNKPTIPAAQVQSDWNASSGMGVILNKPTIPSKTSDLTNDSGFISTETDPTVPAWAKTPTKPTYTAQEVGALPANTSIPSKTSDLTNDSGFIDKAMYYGLCESAASAMPKVCTVETFPTTTTNGVTHAADGTIIAVKFINSDTNTTEAPELNVNGIGAKAIMYNNAIVTSTAKNTTIAGYAKQIAFYRYDPEMDEGNGGWEFLAKSVDSNSTYSQASLGQGYAVQSNSAAATAITASISSYALAAGGIVSIKFAYDVPANATLNISSKGAKAIYNRGAAIAAGVINAGDTATFIYSTYYHLISIDRSDSVTVDSTITQIGTNPVQGGAIYSALADKMQRIVINMEENNDTLTFTDEDDNALTHAQVREVLNNTNNYVLLNYGGLLYLPSFGEWGEDYWLFERSSMIVDKTISIAWDDGIYIEEIFTETLIGDYLDNYVPTTRTINGKALSSDITLNASDVGAMAEATVVEVSTAGAVSQALSPNTFYKFTGALTSLTLTLTAGTGLVVYAGKFTTGSGWGSNGLSIPATVTEATGNDEIAASKTYEFSILDNVIVIKEV